MKNAVVYLEQKGVQIKTSFVDSDKVKWFNDEGSITYQNLLNEGFKVNPQDELRIALYDLEELRDLVCNGYKVKNLDLIKIIKTIRTKLEE